MMPVDKDGEGWFLHLTINEYMEFFVKDQSKDLRNYYLLVASREILADDKRNDRRNMIQHISRYDNIDFVPSLVPKAAAMEYWGADESDRFSSIYEKQLTAEETMTDILCIVDMVVNDNLKVILLHHGFDQKMGWIQILVDLMEDIFNIKCYGAVDLLDPDVDTNDYGDKEEIRKVIDKHKSYLVDSGKAEDFFNTFTDSLEGTYREILSKRSTGDLIDFAMKKGFWVNRKASKEDIIDKIIENTYRAR